MCEDYPQFSDDLIKKGFQGTVQDDFRWMKSNIKSISLLGNVLLKNYASSNGCYETLLIRNKKLTEGSTSNVFIVKDESIYHAKTQVMSYYLVLLEIYLLNFFVKII